MFDLGHTSEFANHALTGIPATDAPVDLPLGIAAGTKVATPQGWRVVEGIAPGDQVLTFDGGMQTVIGVDREIVGGTGSKIEPSKSPLVVPASALGNSLELTLMPHQAVLIESDIAEAVFGDPFAMVPAEALEGYRGIERAEPIERLEIVSLRFARDEVVFANVGALFLCPKARDLLESAVATEPYSVMPLEQADLLVTFLEDEDNGSASADQALELFSAAA